MKPKKYQKFLKTMQRLDDCKSLAAMLNSPEIENSKDLVHKLAKSLESDLKALERQIYRLI